MYGHKGSITLALIHQDEVASKFDQAWFSESTTLVLLDDEGAIASVTTSDNSKSDSTVRTTLECLIFPLLQLLGLDISCHIGRTACHRSP